MHSFVRRLAVTAALGGLLLLSGRSMAQSSTIVNIPTSLLGLYRTERDYTLKYVIRLR